MKYYWLDLGKLAGHSFLQTSDSFARNTSLPRSATRRPSGNVSRPTSAPWGLFPISRFTSADTRRSSKPA
jgi:hypothetical protein